jgi:hypothetical protein
MNIKKSFIGIFITTLIFNTDLTLSQVNFLFDDFESHIPGQQLACQDSVNWTTFFGNPCDPVEDPIITTDHRITGTKSVRIVENNDLVKPFGSNTSGFYYITFWFYIPNGKAGYFNTLAVFNGVNSNWAMECYFDAGGAGRIFGGSSIPVTFNWIENEWQFIKLVVDLMSDEARFYLGSNLIHTWQWTDGVFGTGSPLSIEASDFFGATPDDEMYIDNYTFLSPPLTIPPLFAPTGLTAEEIFNPYPQVQLNWQDNSNYEYAFNILSKHGPLFGAGLLEPIGTAPVNATTYIDSTVVVDSTYTYSVIAYNEFEFSDTITFATIHVVIPVELVSFSYEITGQNDVTLSWITATETNNQGFEIERSQNSDWLKIGFVTGFGTTTEPKSYSFTDANLNAGIYKYRLKQIDFDGTFKYSEIVEAEITTPFEFELSQNYPNPFNPSTKISWQSPVSSWQTLKIYDLLGNEVATLVDEYKTAGKYDVEFSANGLPSGIYFYQLNADDFIQTKKMLVLK